MHTHQPVVAQTAASATLRPTTDVVAASAATLRTSLRQFLQNGAREVTVDFCNVAMLDSTGIGVLIATYNSLQRVNGRLTILNASGDVLQLLQLMRLDRHMNICGQTATAESEATP